MRHFARSILSILILTSATATAQAQRVPKPAPSMHGIVRDTLGRALEGAQVEIAGLKRVITIPASGAYRFDSIPAGKYWVTARRIGYGPIHAALSFKQGEDREVIWELERLAFELPEVTVQAETEAWNRKYQEFVWRSRSNRGRFYTRDDIERMKPNSLADLVRGYVAYSGGSWGFDQGFAPVRFSMSRGTEFVSGGWGRGTLGWSSIGAPSGGSFASGGGPNCQAALSLNGNRPLGNWSLVDFDPADIEAVEVYGSRNQLPAEFAQWGGCGLVVVWLK